MKKLFFLGAASLLLLAACGGDDLPVESEYDAHGCYKPSNYFWNDILEACVDKNKLNSDALEKAAGIALQSVGAGDGVTVTGVTTGCSTCFSVKIRKADGQELVVDLKDWQVVGR